MDGPKVTRNEDLERNDTFQQLIFQAKLLNGAVHYTEREEEILKKMFDKKEKPAALRAFIQEIHTYFPEKRAEFAGSNLNMVLKYSEG